MEQKPVTFYDRFWSIFAGKALWRNPLTILFVACVVLGNFVKDDNTTGGPMHSTGNIGMDLLRSAFGVALIMAFVALICTIVSFKRENRVQPSETHEILED